ncbi:PulJ/GspJ family protein [Crocosphaera chwakensis]|uniref:PulJ/GspJ family protein n=1 Tax=Crocosphaera chwakensis TaxID=2546361 RepID=UPI00031263C1|nr:prepilin-type N-terminal cleavage/methylation domain-containing protein [Crocosphaera chwakensis]
MNINKILPLIKEKKPDTGFTLIELLLGSALMALVVSMAGWGLVYIIGTDQKAAAKETIQYNSNRAVEFLTDEVKLGRRIESDAVAALAEAPDFTLPTGARPILVFQVADVPQRIIYYTRPIGDTEVWEGPDVIERWGPPLDENGEYDPAEINNPGNWESSILIDSIDNTAQTPTCDTGWQPSNTTNSTEGFNACVNPEGKLVKLNLATTTSNKTWQEDVNYQVETMAFARSNIVQGFTDEDTPIFTINGKKLTVAQSADIKFEILGGEITCGAGGVDIPVTTNLYINETKQTWDTDSPLNLPNQESGTTFDVESIAGNRSVCGKYYLETSTADADNQQVEVLVNGDPVPDVAPFGDQSTIESFLTDYIEDGKIKLAENQAIYLFELGSKDKSSSAFDLQDNVVLATVDSAD